MGVLELSLGDGALVFIETDDVGGTGREDMSGVGGAVQESFDKVSSTLAGVVQSMEAQLNRLPSKPDKVSLEMGAKLTGNADLWIVKGEAEGHIKLTLTWGGK